MISIFIAIILGILAGIITGMIPSLHVNTVGIVIFSASTLLLNYISALTIASFLISIAITHAMFEFIPSITVAIPSEDTIMSIQPAHKLLFEGRAYEVIRLVSFGGYLSIVLLIIIMPFLFIILPMIYDLLKDYIGYLLIFIMCIIFIKTRGNYNIKLLSILVFLISGILGCIMLTGNVNSNISLLCMLSGLFSVSNLIYNFNSNNIIPPQKDVHSVNVDNNFKRSVFAGSISGCILGLLPGLGPAQGTMIAQGLTLNKHVTSEDFLITNSGINISDTLFSLIAIYLISNPRSAISVYVSNLISDITLAHIVFFIFISLVVVSVCCMMSIIIGDYIISHMNRVNFRKLNLILIVGITFFIFCYTFYVGGCVWYVGICYVVSIALGIMVNVLGLNKSLLMGVLIIPSILTYLGVI
ncbi:tripartite tricarboxylate transporter permease [uncultured Methanosphaera sp.]|uniref:tripartite tricarboxylate transporter permease n=1 Tax=uncultured Methanosphaera sp. TaxID=262501 RepID=UPI002803D8A2|nr:tripartite tricarboxylate transporter permease [uncultured Methanosphaera sp.]